LLDGAKIYLKRCKISSKYYLFRWMFSIVYQKMFLLQF